MARLLQHDWQQKYVFLAAGTDGSDGPGNTLGGACTAGALIDCGTIQRGVHLGLDVTGCLQQADAGRFLGASGDLFSTGATGANVMDLMLGLKT
jgi:hydroxypyruvate reductase